MGVTDEQLAQAESERQKQAGNGADTHQRGTTIGNGTEQLSAGGSEAEG